MRYFLHIAYQGSNYHGWQRQSHVISIQEEIETAVSKILKQKKFIHGCGRTDAGVHASQFFAHIDIESDLPASFIDKLNYTLPDDISIYNIIPVDSAANAQHNAIKRSYDYYFHLNKIPSLSAVSSYYNVQELDLSAIKEAVEIIKSTEDFRSLCKQPDLYKHTRCKIYSAELIQLPGYRFKFSITADRFLRGMIRDTVARLLDIGQGKLTIEEFSSTLSQKNDFGFKHSKIAYPQGLYLSKVVYPFLDLPAL